MSRGADHLSTKARASILGVPALSIRQPWCERILGQGKDIENRDWPTRYRGWFLIHASQTFDGDRASERAFRAAHGMPFGGIVGMARIVDCVAESDSDWFCGRYGFVLEDAVRLPFIAMKGKLGLFSPPIGFWLSHAGLMAKEVMCGR